MFQFGPVTFTIDHTRPYVNTAEYLERQGIGGSRRFPRAHLDAWLAQQQITWPRLLLQRLNWRNSQIRVEDPRRSRASRSASSPAPTTRPIRARPTRLSWTS